MLVVSFIVSTETRPRANELGIAIAGLCRVIGSALGASPSGAYLATRCPRRGQRDWMGDREVACRLVVGRPAGVNSALV